jgi:hypothetical protein
MRIAAIIVGAILFFNGIPAQATKLVGKVVVTPEFRASLAKAESLKRDGNHDYYWKIPNGFVSELPPRVRLSSDISLLMFKEGADSPKPDALATVKVHVGSLEKQVIATRPGSTIKFRNVDPFDHELYSPQMPSFKPEHQSNGAFRPVEFPTEGVFEVKCKLVPDFSAYIVVTNATNIIPLARDGSISVENLDPGNYSVKVFHGGKWVHTQSIVIDSNGTFNLQIKLLETTAANDGDKPTETKKDTK